MSRLEQTSFGVAGIGEGPALEAEQFGLQQSVGDRSAVDRDKRSGRPRPRFVDSAGEQSFAGSRLTEDQDGRKAARPGLAPEQLFDLIPDSN